jgi:hypothetical protein
VFVLCDDSSPTASDEDNELREVSSLLRLFEFCGGGAGVEGLLSMLLLSSLEDGTGHSGVDVSIVALRLLSSKSASWARTILERVLSRLEE